MAAERGADPAAGEAAATARESSPRSASRLALGPRSLVLVPLVLAAVVHRGVLDHYFIGDEFIHFYNLMNFGLLELLLTPHGGHLLVTSNSTYFLFHALFGYESFFYYAVALLTHVLNAGLLFLVIRTFTGSGLIAVAGSTVWAVSPLDAGSVGWFGVYGHVMLASFLLVVLYDVARLARGQAEASTWMLARWYALTLAAATSFGFGLAIALAFGPVLYLLLAGREDRTRISLRFSSLLVVVPGLYLLLHGVHQALSGRAVTHGVMASFSRTPFTLADWPAVPLAFLDYLSFGIASLPLGFLVASQSASVASGPLEDVPLDAVMQLCRGVALVCVIALALAFRRSTAERRSQALGLLLLVVACYGTIAFWAAVTGRGTLAKSAGMLPVWQAMTPRYHYVAPMLLTIIACLPFGQHGRRVALRGWELALLIVAGLLLAGASERASRALRLPDLRAKHQAVVGQILRIVEQAPAGADVYILNRPFTFWGYSLKDRFPGWAAVFVISFPDDVVDGRRVFFVERNPRLRERVTSRDTRISRLVVAPEATGGTPPR